ncbi:MAG: hypothetical protein ACI9GW_003247 [Halieaceae bacterium]|jgi:hypothetical protein
MEFFSSINQSAPENLDFSRRRLLGGALALPALGSLAAFAGAPEGASTAADTRNITRGPRMESRLFSYDDPEQHQIQSFRILRNTHDNADVLFWYHFTMYVVVEGYAPRPVVRWEGIEFSHHRRLAKGIYRIHGHNLSFPRDLHTGHWTDTALNPVTGAKVKVPPLALTEDPGYLYTPEGVVPLDNPGASPRIRTEQFLVEDDLIKIEQVRVAPASWPATFIETSTNWCNRTLFEDTALPSLPTGTSGGYIFPFPAWLEMGEQQGHMFATWSGRKLGSVAELPDEFMRRAMERHSGLLAVDMSVFNRPLPKELSARIGV